MEAAAGDSFEELLVTKIITPLSMTSTFPSSSESHNKEILEQIAKPYHVDEAGNITPANYRSEGYVNAASGLISTVLDLAKFDAAMDRNLLVTADSKAALFTPTRSNDGEMLPYGMGWFVQEYAGTEARLALRMGSRLFVADFEDSRVGCNADPSGQQ